MLFRFIDFAPDGFAVKLQGFERGILLARGASRPLSCTPLSLRN